ncbi:hypothetical protein DD237_006072 [Peronospora effusa]|uniref:Thioredoxin domain-containing protein n=1 Tax=Peronospora effusa TaxID=542832 RepID=A0A3R7XUC1_9STRA|nr:hypothetical protein DD237_006072 [Peronospora effusa]
MGKKWSEFLAGAGLFIFNGVDLIAGISLSIYSLYIGIHHYAPVWFYVPLFTIGSILIVASLMSGCGVAFQNCSVCMTVSSNVLGWISLAELGLAIVILTQGRTIDKFLHEHKNELKLSGDQLAQFERHKFYPAYALLVLCLMEVLRQRYSITLHHARLRRQYQYEMLTTVTVSTPDAVTTRMWVRFLAPYYICNAVALLLYVPIRYHQSSEALTASDNYFNLPLEYEIFLLALGSWALNYRKKATADGVISIFFLCGKLAVLASLYYMDITLFGWYAVDTLLLYTGIVSMLLIPFLLRCYKVLFAAVGQPKYEGPSKIIELNPALVEKVVKKSSGSKNKGPPNSWMIFYYADWSDSCMEIEPMLAEMSLRYSSRSLQFGRIDVNKWSDLAVENRISVSTLSWQLPTLILFQNGEEVMRLPPIDDNGKVTKMILDRSYQLESSKALIDDILCIPTLQAGLVAVFKLEELKEGKSVVSKPKTS